MKKAAASVIHVDTVSAEFFQYVLINLCELLSRRQQLIALRLIHKQRGWSIIRI